MRKPKYKIEKRLDPETLEPFWVLLEGREVISTHDYQDEAHAAAQEAVAMDREGY